MKLHNVFLDNFGLFRGAHQIDLSPIPNKPLTLIAGMNGAGKTTFLEAVQLTLYGRAALGPRVSLREYQSHLKQRVHRGNGEDDSLSSAMVGVEFEHETMGATARFKISRAWCLLDNGAVEETFEVLRDGSALDDVDSQHWEDFVKELVPPGISQLFFFDGEKIQRLADDEDSSLVGESIKALLGLDMVERLQADLTLFRDRQMKKSGSAELKEELSAMRLAHEKLVKQAEVLRAQSADLVARRDGISREVERSEGALTRAGGRFVENREQQTIAKVRAEAEREAAERKIRALADTALPLAFCPKLSSRLLTQLDDERKVAQQAVIADWAGQALERAHEAIGRADFLEGRRDDTLALVQSLLRVEFTGGSAAIHRLSEESERRIQSWIDQANGPLWDDLVSASADLELATRELQGAQVKLQQMPEEDSMKPQMQDLRAVIERKAVVEAELVRIAEELNALKLAMDASERGIKKLQSRLDVSGRLADQLKLLERTQGALIQYHESLTAAKAQKLGEEITACFHQLHRKGDLVQSIAVEPVTCSVRLHGRGGRELAKNELSAGEKQMYAVALLWGLSKVSGRHLPLIIDTPLGRLDSNHRDNLVQRYFPQAARQVIILSTDTEIDEAYYAALTPHIGRAYRLEYNKSQAKTEVFQGYFWHKESLCSV